MLVYNSEQKQLVVKNRHVSGIKLHTHLDISKKDATGALIAPDGTEKLDFSKVLLSVKLDRNGEEILFQDTLKALVTDQEFSSPLLTVLIGTGVAIGGNKMLFPLEFNFNQVMNLRANDTITVELTLMEGYFTGKATDSAKSYVDFEAIDGIGVEYVTPFVVVKNIPQNESRFTLNLGNNVQSISVIDTTNKSSLDPASNAIQRVSLYSDKINVTDTFADLVSKRIQGFDTPELASKRGNSFMIYNNPSTDLDDCRLELSLDPAKVASGQYAVVVRHYTTNRAQINLARNTKTKHVSRAQAKL